MSNKNKEKYLNSSGSLLVARSLVSIVGSEIKTLELCSSNSKLPTPDPHQFHDKYFSSIKILKCWMKRVFRPW
jgi:hypothetical protein